VGIKMANTYNWIIKKLETKNIGDIKNVVFNIHWDLSITDGINAVNASGIQGLEYQDNQSFTPYENLTEKQVTDWIINFPVPEGITSIFTLLEDKLATMATQQNTNNTLPWENP